MSLLDFDSTYKPPYKPGEFTREGKRRHKETALSQETRDSELNNLDREVETEDYSNSNHLNY